MQAPPAIASGTQLIFSQTSQLDPLILERFSWWFAFHLSNTEYKWPFWTHWTFVAELEEGAAQRVFVSSTLEHLCRLSYMDRIMRAIPKELASLLPPPPDAMNPFQLQRNDDKIEDEKENNTNEEDVLARISEDVMNRISAKEEGEKIREWLEQTEPEVPIENSRPGLPCAKAWRAAVVINAVLLCGRASPTHANALVDRYLDLLSDFTDEEEDLSSENQRAMLHVSAYVWQCSPQGFTQTVDMLARRDVLTSPAIRAFVLGPENAAYLAYTPYLWEAIKLDIDFTIERVKLTRQAVSKGQLEPADLEDALIAAHDLCVELCTFLITMLWDWWRENHLIGGRDLKACENDVWWMTVLSYLKGAIRTFAGGEEGIWDKEGISSAVEPIRNEEGFPDGLEAVLKDLRNV
jgi:hypothetical protein